MDSQPKPRSSKSRQSLNLFITSMRGEHPSGDPGCEYCAELSTVSQHLLDLSGGAHQWASVPSYDLGVSNEKRSRRYLIAGYSNPERGGLPNLLCFCFPLFIYRSASGSELTHLVCLAAESTVGLSGGLYWEDEQLKKDSFEDYCRFMNPLNERLWPAEKENPSSSVESCEQLTESATHTLEDISYSESITDLVRFWSQSRERLLQKIEW
jgi:hypothetical protein